MDKILLATNGPMDRIFTEGLQKVFGAQVEVSFIPVNSRKSSFQKFQRQFYYFLLALRTLRQRQRYSRIIFVEQFVGLYYGILAWLLPIRRSGPPSVILTTVYRHRPGWKNLFHRQIFRKGLNSPLVSAAVCSSFEEKQRYEDALRLNDPNRLMFILFGSKSPLEKNHYPERIGEQYFLATGTTGRDYRNLLKAFARMPQQKLKIICNSIDVEGLFIPPNVEILGRVFGDEYQRLLSQSAAVIIPLIDPGITSGLLGLIDALRMGKPVLITRNCFSQDYGGGKYYQLFEPHSSDAIELCVQEFLARRDYWEDRAMKGMEFYKENLTESKYVERICGLLSTLKT